jgi:hypothetical protein
MMSVSIFGGMVWHFLILFGNCGNSSVRSSSKKEKNSSFVINFVWFLFYFGALVVIF